MYVCIVAYLLKARTVETQKQPLIANGSETTFVARQRLGKHVRAATNTHETIEVLLETVFSTRSVPRRYKEDNWGNQVSERELRVEAGSKTSTVALRVVGGDEGTQCLGV
jgi:hypothetical protein